MKRWSLVLLAAGVLALPQPAASDECTSNQDADDCFSWTYLSGAYKSERRVGGQTLRWWSMWGHVDGAWKLGVLMRRGHFQYGFDPTMYFYPGYNQWNRSGPPREVEGAKFEWKGNGVGKYGTSDSLDGPPPIVDFKAKVKVTLDTDPTRDPLVDISFHSVSRYWASVDEAVLDEIDRRFDVQGVPFVEGSRFSQRIGYNGGHEVEGGFYGDNHELAGGTVLPYDETNLLRGQAIFTAKRQKD